MRTPPDVIKSGPMKFGICSVHVAFSICSHVIDSIFNFHLNDSQFFVGKDCAAAKRKIARRKGKFSWFGITKVSNGQGLESVFCWNSNPSFRKSAKKPICFNKTHQIFGDTCMRYMFALGHISGSVYAFNIPAFSDPRPF